MKSGLLEVLRCPRTGEQLRIQRTDSKADGEIESGTLTAVKSGTEYPIRNFVPRFVQDDGYAANFGQQWNKYRKTQIDRIQDFSLTGERFYASTQWTPEELEGRRILEVGSGAGRLTQLMLSAGAEVFSVDYTSAVDANWANNGPHPRLHLVQGDIYELPFQPDQFDFVFCYGVRQHTPDARRAFTSLLPFLARGGKLSVDVYVKERWPTRWSSKYLWRWLTTRIPPQTLLKIVEWYVPRWLPIDNWFQEHLPRWISRYIVGVVPCWNYAGILNLTSDQLVEWAILDTFDALSSRYDFPQDLTTVRNWFSSAPLRDIDVRYGSNGIVGNAVKA